MNPNVDLENTIVFYFPENTKAQLMFSKKNIYISPVQTGCVETDLSVEVVGQAVQELTLNGVLLGEQGQVMTQLVVGGNDGALAVLVELGATCTPENLHDVQDAQINHGAALGIVDLCALYTDTGGSSGYIELAKYFQHKRRSHS